MTENTHVIFVIAVTVVLSVALIVELAWERRSSRRLQAKLSEFQSRLSVIESRLDLRPIIPPMSIFLEPIEHRWHVVDELCRRIDEWMLSHDFDRVGYFRIEELDNEELCAYLSHDGLLVASVRLANDATEPYVEFCFDLGDGNRGGTCNPPISTIRPLESDLGSHFEGKLSSNFKLIDSMYDRACELAIELCPIPVDRQRIAQFFEEAHANEMACRINSGGVTEAEIRDVLNRQGVRPTEMQVAFVQRQWQQAIEDYLLEFSARGKNRQVEGDRILIVYEGSVHSYLVDQLVPFIARLTGQPRQSEKLCNQLHDLLRRFDPREAIARFRPLLPIGQRFDLVDQIARPVPADVYALPPSEH